MKMMDRYVVKELIVPFIAGSFAIALLFAANQLIFILKSFPTQSIPPSAMFQMIFYRMPFWLNYTLPAGISLAASLAITRLARESEITAMRAVGVPVLRVILPVAVFGVVIAGGNYLLVEKVMPKTERKARQLELDATIASAAPGFQSNVWINLKQWHATFGSVTRETEDSITIKDIVLGERPSGDVVTFVSSPSGVYKNGIWTFDDALFWMISPKTHKLTFGPAKTMTVPQPIFVNDVFETQVLPQDKTAAELAATIRQGQAAGHDMTREEVQYYERFSVPAACIVFAIIAPIFAVTFARTGSFVGVLLSIVLVLLYYNAFVISTEVFGFNHWVSPWIAAWLPNFVFAALGLIGLRRLE